MVSSGQVRRDRATGWPGSAAAKRKAPLAGVGSRISSRFFFFNCGTLGGGGGGGWVSGSTPGSKKTLMSSECFATPKARLCLTPSVTLPHVVTDCLNAFSADRD